MGCGLSKPSHQPSDGHHPQTRPRHRHPQEKFSEQGRIAQERDRPRVQRSGNNHMDGPRQAAHAYAQAREREQLRIRRLREEQHREEIHRLGEKYMETFWEDAHRVQERVKAQNRKRFRLS